MLSPFVKTYDENQMGTIAKVHVTGFFSYIFQKMGFDISCKLSPTDGDNLYEMTKPVFWKKKKKKTTTRKISSICSLLNSLME